MVVNQLDLKIACRVQARLAVSMAHFFFGELCILTQRNLFKQVLGFCLMENGSHLTLALLAYNAPELVEIGIATDAVFGVVIMVVLGTADLQEPAHAGCRQPEHAERIRDTRYV